MTWENIIDSVTCNDTIMSGMRAETKYSVTLLIFVEAQLRDIWQDTGRRLFLQLSEFSSKKSNFKNAKFKNAEILIVIESGWHIEVLYGWKTLGRKHILYSFHIIH